MPYYITPPPMNPLSRVLTAILAVLVLVGAFFFGVFVLAFAAGLGLVAWLYLSIRLWWLRRKGGIPGPGQSPEGENPRTPGSGPRPDGRDIIDAEYTVIKKQDEET